MRGRGRLRPRRSARRVRAACQSSRSSGAARRGLVRPRACSPVQNCCRQTPRQFRPPRLPRQSSPLECRSRVCHGGSPVVRPPPRRGRTSRRRSA
ncbi:hypothetical protein EVA_10982 [gut metagenome]|uniref:Uncharacterized protein n=1 Tax=gut metagenome TaxID=749906 RepID=J9GGH1_9ZZZZ